MAVVIREIGRGTALGCEARLSLDGQDDNLGRQFSAQADATYNTILTDHAQLDVEHSDFIILARRFQQAQAHIHSALERRA